MRVLLAIAASIVVGCGTPAPRHIVRVGVGAGFATSYDALFADGLAILADTGWQWSLVPRGDVADVTIEHADLDCARDVGGFFDPATPGIVHVDPVCSSGVVPLVTAHELLHWAGCSHVAGAGSVLSATIENAPDCDPTVQSCVVTAMAAADIDEWRRVHP